MDPIKSAAKAVDKAATTIAAVAKALGEPPVPGAPAPEPPSLAEPTEPREPLPPKPDQDGPETRTADRRRDRRAEDGQRPAGRVPDHGARACASARHRPLAEGRRARADAAAGPPPAREDHALRPRADPRARRARARCRRPRDVRRLRHRRRACARAGVPGRGRGDAGLRALLHRARLARLGRHRARHPRASRRSSTPPRATSTSSATTSRSSSSRTASSSPTSSTPGKPHPDREIPQAQSAHDTFWDFVSLHTEAQHHTMWNMSDRGIPRSYRMMEGFGVHTFRLSTPTASTTLVKFHWKPVLGVHSLVWEEAQMLGRHRPRLPPPRPRPTPSSPGAYPAVGAGHPGLRGHPGADLRGHRPARPDQARARGAGAGAAHRPADAERATRPTTSPRPSRSPSTRAPGARHRRHRRPAARRPGCSPTSTPSSPGSAGRTSPRSRSTARTRRSTTCCRDGFHQHAVHGGVAPYRPNSLDGGCPFRRRRRRRRVRRGAGRPSPRRRRSASAPASFDDHYSQARLFWLSMTPGRAGAHRRRLHLRAGQVLRAGDQGAPAPRLANIDAELCAQVADRARPARRPSRPCRSPSAEPSPALSQVGGTWPVDGRVVGIVVDADGDLDGSQPCVRPCSTPGMVPLVVAAHGGKLGDGLAGAAHLRHGPLGRVRRRAARRAPRLPAPDALAGRDVKAGEPDAGLLDPRVVLLLQEAYRHAKAIGAWGPGADGRRGQRSTPVAAGVLVGDEPERRPRRRARARWAGTGSGSGSRPAQA